eukprot:6345217-Pyramimonas_sp.AAC.1
MLKWVDRCIVCGSTNPLSIYGNLHHAAINQRARRECGRNFDLHVRGFAGGRVCPPKNSPDLRGIHPTSGEFT